jgi:hypothetical protein
VPEGRRGFRPSSDKDPPVRARRRPSDAPRRSRAPGRSGGQSPPPSARRPAFWRAAHRGARSRAGAPAVANTRGFISSAWRTGCDKIPELLLWVAPWRSTPLYSPYQHKTRTVARAGGGHARRAVPRHDGRVFPSPPAAGVGVLALIAVPAPGGRAHSTGGLPVSTAGVLRPSLVTACAVRRRRIASGPARGVSMTPYFPLFVRP